MNGPVPLGADAAEAGSSIADAARDYLARDALPFWSEHGTYRNGCFVEHLDLSGRPIDPGFTRVRVQARQIYAFSHAHAANVHGAPRTLPMSVDFLIKAAWLGPERGWARRISRHGDVVDDAYDLYDVAFALFALAWSYRIAPEPRLLRIATDTLDFLERRARHPFGGYMNDSGPALPRQQNPHMHMTEAMIAWFEASGLDRFLDVAGQLVELCRTRFVDEGGALGEFFEEDWTPFNGPLGSIVEPGHQFEWAWILGEYGRLSGADTGNLVERLITFALSNGFDEQTGLTKDKLDRSGRIIDASHRLWPQTEALKACVVAEKRISLSMPLVRRRAFDALFHFFLNAGPVRGTWIDHYTADWSIKVDRIPATSLYHVTLAFLELLSL